MTDTNAPRQLRLIIETDDFEGTLRFYRDVLGMPEQVAHAGGGDERVAILLAGTGTIEIASPTHARRIDEVEGVPSQASTMRLALEVDDARRAVVASTDAGSAVLGTPRETPFRSLNARIQGPAGWQITLFQELETVEQRRDRPGFARDHDRER